MKFQKYRQGIKGFDWAKSLPDVLANYNTEYHSTLHNTHLEVLQGRKSNPVKRRIVQSILKKGDRVRIKTQKTIYSKGYIQTFSDDIYLITQNKGN